jgi:hypothetical protein
MSYLSKFILTCISFSFLTFLIIFGVYQTFFFEKDEFYIKSKVILKLNNDIPKILFVKETTFIQNYDYFLSLEFRPHEVFARFNTEFEFWKLASLNDNEKIEDCKLFNDKTRRSMFSVEDGKSQIITITLSNFNEKNFNDCVNQLKHLIKNIDEKIKNNIMDELNTQENFLFNSKNETIKESKTYYLKKMSEYKEQVKRYSILEDIKIFKSKEIKTNNFIKFSPIILLLCFLCVIGFKLILQDKKNKILLYDQINKLF